MSHPDTESPPELIIDHQVATLRLNRPSKRNRLEPEDLRLLMAHCERIHDAPDLRVVVLTANTAGQPQPTFCAGYDMGGFEGSAQDTDLFENMVQALAGLRPVLIGALNGSVYGGATDMALACDIRIGLKGGVFRMPATALGLHYYPSGLRRFVAHLGINGARWAFLTARPISFDKLERWGVLMDVVDPTDFEDVIGSLVQEIRHLAPLAIQGTKQSLQEIALGTDDLEPLRQRQLRTLRSVDFAEGRQAFADRRLPVFQGR